MKSIVLTLLVSTIPQVALANVSEDRAFSAFQTLISQADQLQAVNDADLSNKRFPLKPALVEALRSSPKWTVSFKHSCSVYKGELLCHLNVSRIAVNKADSADVEQAQEFLYLLDPATNAVINPVNILTVE